MNNCADDFEVIIDEPVSIKPNFDNIPNDFKEHPNWLLWKLELTAKGKWTKIPYQINGKKADSTKPNTWSTFDNVVAAFNTGNFSGIGFAIGNSGLTCIDIDHEEQWIISDLKAIYTGLNNKFYQETSPSGDGKHLWVKAVKPDGMGCKSKNFHNSLIEVYDSSRFITMTGNKPIGSIQECQSEFDQVFKPLIKQAQKVAVLPTAPSNNDNQTVLDIVFHSKQRDAFYSLHDGGSKGDASGEDMTYMNILAFYTCGNAHQMDSIYRQSALVRDKWDSRRGSSTYGQQTIDKAIAECTKFYSPMGEFTFEDISKHEPDNDPFNLKEIDITKPHGLLGELCQEQKEMAHRDLPLIYPLVGLHVFTAICGRRPGVHNTKINLLTLLIGLTAAGKNIGNDVIGQVARNIDRVKTFKNEPISSKDVIVNLIEGEGHCFYEVDEAHGLFDAMKSKGAAAYKVAIGKELLLIATSRNYTLSGSYQRNYIETYSKELSTFTNKIESLEGDLSKVLLLKKYEGLRDQAIRTIDMIENGFPNPSINMMMCSTPEKIDSLGNGENIESGLLGRSLIWRVYGGREEAIFTPERSHLSKELLFKLSRLDSKKPIIIDADAEIMLREMFDYYEQDEFRNHPTKGGLYARIIERIRTISSLLAVETGIVTTQDLRYSLAAVLRHIDDVEFLRKKSVSNDGAQELGDHVMDLIIKRIPSLGLPQSKMKQTVLASCKAAKEDERQAKRENRKTIYDQALEFLISSGSVEIKKMRIHKT